MNQKIIEELLNWLMWISLDALLLIAAVCAYVGLRRLGKALCVRLSPVAIGVFAVAAIVATGEAQKRLLRGGALDERTLPECGALGDRALPNVTAEEIAQGWRLESVVTNDAVSYVMPTNGVEYMPWSLGGGYEAHFPLDLGDFAFPFGTNVVRRVDVVSGGMVESFPRPSCMSICAAREYASIVPGVGRFWWADTARSASGPYQAKLMTWENVYAGRDRMGQYNAQIELCGDGNFITRSNNVERVYRRVLSHDWDNDGLPNTIDPAPETPLVPSAWNQSEEWAAAAFPSNAAEIAAMGGYAAWVAARGADPDRRLVSLGVAFDEGSAWPTMLDFGGVPVMADGAAELSFAIDCGARVPFTITSGRLASVEVTATLPPMRSGGGGTTISRELFPLLYSYPYECSVGDVKVHFDGPRSGWLCRTAGVDVAPSQLPHFHPADSAELTATVLGCHSNAYIGCTWTGGDGMQFSNPHLLSTTVTYDPDDPEDWATNGIDLVTQFVGYTLTNHVHFTVGITNEPPLAFSLGCQRVFFLNDAELGSPSNRPERIRPVSLNLTGPLGTNGTARLSVQGGVDPVMFHVVNGVTNRVTAETEFPLAVTNDFEHTESYTIYVSCPNIGTCTITATFTPSGGGTLTDSATFRCIEPLRKLVTTEKMNGRYVNPSRLVMGTNAVLKVGANGPFSPSEVDWRVVSGPARIVAVDGWCATVEPTGTDADVVVEARFNDDEIQPRFVLPVVEESVLHVRVFAVKPLASLKAPRWDRGEIESWFRSANEIYSQVGVRFVVDEVRTEGVGTAEDWILSPAQAVALSDGSTGYRLADQILRLLNVHTSNDCIKVVLSGSIKVLGREVAAFTIPTKHPRQGVFIGRMSNEFTLAHELGHALGLEHCLSEIRLANDDCVYIEDGDLSVSKSMFPDGICDWGVESGRGFYSKDDVRSNVIESLVMLGVGASGKTDIPDGRIISLTETATSSYSIWYPKVGARYLQTDARKVYTHEK